MQSPGIISDPCPFYERPFPSEHIDMKPGIHTDMSDPCHACVLLLIHDAMLYVA